MNGVGWSCESGCVGGVLSQAALSGSFECESTVYAGDCELSTV